MELKTMRFSLIMTSAEHGMMEALAEDRQSSAADVVRWLIREEWRLRKAGGGGSNWELRGGGFGTRTPGFVPV